MVKKGRVINAQTGEGIEMASIELTDVNGTYLGIGTTADVYGDFVLDSLLFEPGTFLRISSAGGYATRSFSYADYLQRTTFDLQPAGISLPDVVVTAPAAGQDIKKGLLWFGIIAAGLVLLNSKR